MLSDDERADLALLHKVAEVSRRVRQRRSFVSSTLNFCARQMRRTARATHGATDPPPAMRVTVTGTLDELTVAVGDWRRSAAERLVAIFVLTRI